MSSERVSHLAQVDRPAGFDNRPSNTSRRNIDFIDAIHEITLKIVRSPHLEFDLPDIARSICAAFDLHTVSLLLHSTGWSVHAGPEKIIQPTTNLPQSKTNQAELEQIADVYTSSSGGNLKPIPLRTEQGMAGYMLVRAFGQDEIDPVHIRRLQTIGDLLAEVAAREAHARTLPGNSATDTATQLLEIISRLTMLGTIDTAIEPLLTDIAELSEADLVSLVIPDPVRPRMFSTRPHSSDTISRLLTTQVVRLALDTGDPQTSAHQDLDPNSAILAVPVAARRDPVGVLVFERRLGWPFTLSEQETAGVIGRHLAYSLERERRIKDFSRQNLLLALVERVTAFIAHSTDTDDLMNRMVREIRRTFGYDCSIAMINGDRLVIQAIDLGDPDAVPDWITEGIPLNAGVMGRVARTGEPAFVHNVQSDPAFLDTGRDTVSEIAMPIRAGQEVVGVLNVESGIDNPLQILDYEILHILAHHIGIALGNRQLIASEREARIAIEVIQKVSTIVAETLDPEESLRRIANTLGESFSYPVVSLVLLEGQWLVRKSNYGYDLNSYRRKIHISEGITGRVARTGRPVLLEDVRADPDYVREREDLLSEVCVPIRCGGEIVGVLNVEGNKDRPVTQRDLELLTTFAEHAGVLLNNARAYAALSREATLDPMTGVPNLRYLQQALHEQIEHSRREDRPLSLAVVDLDNLKVINDTYGHLVGDQVLRDIARRMMNQLHDNDILARYAGDEFVVILPDVDNERSLEVAEHLLNSARRYPFEGDAGVLIPISLSIGVATFPQDASSATDLLRTADMAMYGAKDSGKNRANAAGRSVSMSQRSKG